MCKNAVLQQSSEKYIYFNINIFNKTKISMYYSIYFNLNVP